MASFEGVGWPGTGDGDGDGDGDGEAFLLGTGDEVGEGVTLTVRLSRIEEDEPVLARFCFSLGSIQR